MPNTKRRLSQNPDIDDYRTPTKNSAKRGGALSTISSQIGDKDHSTYEKPGYGRSSVPYGSQQRSHSRNYKS